MPRFNFNAKVLLPLVGLMAALVASTLWVINSRIADQVRSFADEALFTSRVVFETFRALRAKDLSDPSRSIQNEPRFKATMLLGDPPTMEQLLQEVLRERELDFVVVGDAFGRVVAVAVRSPELALVDDTGQSVVDLAGALDGNVTTAVISAAGRLLDVVVAPVVIAEQIAGTVAAGWVLGDAAARDMSRLTGCEVALFAGEQLVALSMEHPIERRDLTRLLASSAKPLSGAQDADTVRDVVLHEEHYRVLGGLLDAGSASEQDSAYMLLGHYERQLQRLRETRQLLVALGMGGVLLGTLVAWGIVRGATRPLRLLRDGVEAVGRGDLTRRVDVISRDELSDLTMAFNAMTENLRASRESLERTVATLRTTQAQLLQSEKLSAIGAFIAGVAHELNNPLTIMVGFAGLLRETALTPEQQQHVRLMEDAADRCHKVVQNLLSFARQRPPERVPVNVNELLETTLRFLAYELKTGGIAVTLDLAPKLPAVRGDPHQLQQVFLNVINNARQAMEQGHVEGKLQVATSPHDGRVRISIADNGPGIPAESMSKIFDPFFTTKAAGKGTGLGLSVSYGIIQEHGGTLRVESEVGHGATFFIELPVSGPGDVEVSASVPLLEAPWNANRPLRSLVVDDEDGVLELVRQLLGDAGVTTDVCRDGLAALVAVGRESYDVIVCDWRMPGLGGREFLEALRQSQPEVARRLIFMTGDVLNEEMLAFVQNSGCPCLTKPFTAAELLAAVKRVTLAIVETRK